MTGSSAAPRSTSSLSMRSATTCSACRSISPAHQHRPRPRHWHPVAQRRPRPIALRRGPARPSFKPYDQLGRLSPRTSRNPASIVNFIAAYGTHASIECGRLRLDAKRDAAMELVSWRGPERAAACRRIVSQYPQQHRRLDRVANSGLNLVSTLWIGGLAEKKMPFGGMLGSTFKCHLRVAARKPAGRRIGFYYLTPHPGSELPDHALEQNSFAKMIMANTDLAQARSTTASAAPPTTSSPATSASTSFANYDYVLEVNIGQPGRL